MLALLVIWAILALLLLPSMALLWKTPNGKIVFLCMVLVYVVANALYAYLIRDEVNDALLNWGNEPVLFVVVMLAETVVFLLFAFAWKCWFIPSLGNRRKLVIAFPALLAAGLLCGGLVNGYFHFSPHGEAWRRVLTGASLLALIASAVLLLLLLIEAAKTKHYPSVYIALLLLLPVFFFPAKIFTMAAVQSDEQLFDRKLQETLTSPGGKWSVYVYSGNGYGKSLYVYAGITGHTLVDEVYSGISSGNFELIRLSDETLKFSCDEYRSSGWFWSQTVVYPQYVIYNFEEE